MQSDEEFTLELTTIARLLTLKTQGRRAVKLDNTAPIYRIENRSNSKPTAYILFQPINKNLSQINAAPVKLALAKNAAKIAAENRLPLFILFHWSDSIFGLAKAASYFELEDWQKPANNPQIIFAPKDNFTILYGYDNTQNYRKINPLDAIK
jgi:hypothetical protein